MTQRHDNHGLRKICDCPRRTWAKCAHSWHFSYKYGETHYRFSLDKHAGRHLELKTEAEDLAAEIKKAIRSGKFGQVQPVREMTLTQMVNVYLERYVDVERQATGDDFRSGLNVICKTPIPCPTEGTVPFGDWRLSDIVTDTIERFREARRTIGTGPGGTNRSLSRLRAVYNWAVRTGYVEKSPYKRGTEAVVRLSRETPRSRRLDADRDEATKLLNACGPHLRALVEGALETGMRFGELSGLLWRQVVGMKIDTTTTPITIAWAPRSEIVLLAAQTKTRRDRRIPISTRLKAILEMRRCDPNGQPLADETHVFGNVLGQRVHCIKRSWMTAVLKSHGEKVVLTETMNLNPEGRAKLAEINLHFHDLRREAGSRWLEGGVPLHTVRDWLGHTSIAQTSVYLSGTMQTQHDAMTAYENRLQRLATDDGTGHQKTPSEAEGCHEIPNGTGPDRQTAIM